VTASPHWTAIAERGSLLGMRLTVRFYRLFGRRLSALFILPVVAYFFLTDRRGRRASRQYLERLYRRPGGREALGHPPGLWDSFRHYREFALVILDRVCLWLGQTDRFDIAFDGREHFTPLLREGRGAILVSAHVGSFDCLRLLAERTGIRVSVVMFTRHAAKINRIFQDLNRASTLRVIEVDPGSIQSVFEIQERVEAGEFVALLGDRLVGRNRRDVVEVDFLGVPAAFPSGPFLLAGALRCSVILMVGLRTGDAKYEVFAETLAEQVVLPHGERSARLRDLVTAYAGRLEGYCLRAPYQWFNFFDFWAAASRFHSRP
jgi:predicted LPLAT superfamily acyltransferase